MLNYIFNNKNAVQFRVPVDWKLYGLLDYPKVIKRPRDIGTVKSKLKNHEYVYIEQILNDLQLIWENCYLYNQKESVRGVFLISQVDWKAGVETGDVHEEVGQKSSVGVQVS